MLTIIPDTTIRKKTEKRIGDYPSRNVRDLNKKQDILMIKMDSLLKKIDTAKKIKYD